jgi:hypothetical protein
MADSADRKPDGDDALLDEVSIDLARAIWNIVLLARDEAKARGLVGQAERRRLVDRIKALARVVKGGR